MFRFIFWGIMCCFSIFGTSCIWGNNGDENPCFETKDLSLNEFNNPSLEYAPLTRWWWPGNDVNQQELVREMQLFAENNIGGVEIQPFALVLPAKGKGRGDRIMSYDTPNYYENLIRVMEEAKKLRMTVDMTDGSGWPAGGPHLSAEDNNLTLEYGMIDLHSGRKAKYKIPRPFRGDHQKAKLITLLAAKVKKNNIEENQPLSIDASTVKNISEYVTDSTFQFQARGEDWKAIAFWSVPTMEKPMLIAKRDAGFVMNHFDSAKVFKNYNYFFGERTGLQPYFGKPFRAIFDDSYEFKADRHFSDDFISTFEKNRGYDITPYLPANMWYGYNNMYYRMEHPQQKPEFSFGKEDWRLRYDYDLTLSDVIGTQFLKAAGDWTKERGLMHRSQPYGLHIDNMALAGLIDIPEVETMQFNKGSEGAYKLISSGAHLYNRPLISCESAVYINRGYMTTPQKLKLTLDKIFSCGVNHVVWHGTAYRYFPGGYPEEGWYPFMNAYVPINFSSDLNESNPFWKYMKDINGYAQRAQYVLRSGKPNADVLIYYPFLSYSEHSANPNEILLNGYIEEVEPSLESENVTSSYHPAINSDWLDKLWPLINELNARGITWDWVNDASLQEMNITGDKLISIRGNEYQSLILFDLPYIQVESAKHVEEAAIEGANILALGELPDKQPSFYNYEKNDELMSKALRNAVQEPSVHHIGELKGLAKWESSLSLPIANRQEYGFIRQIRRKMEDGSLVQFIWNTSSEWQKVQLSLHEPYRYAAWLNAEDGSVQKTAVKEDMVEYLLPPLSTVFLYVSEKSIKMESSVVFSEFNPFNVSELMTIDKWNLTCDSVTIENTALFNWRENDQMKYKMTEGVYSSVFELDNLDEGAEYYIDFGKVYFSGDLEINGKIVGSRIFAPFNFNMTDFLKTGKNNITLKVTPTLLNGFIGRGNSGVREYKNYKDKGLMSQGLIGPVKIFKQKK